jgi:hypothetical protein
MEPAGRLMPLEILNVAFVLFVGRAWKASPDFCVSLVRGSIPGSCRQRLRIWIDHIRVGVLGLADRDRGWPRLLRIRIWRRQPWVVVSHFDRPLSNNRLAALNDAKNHGHDSQY